MAVTRTANTITCTALNDAVAGQFKITGVVYAGATTAAHVCEIKDGYAGSGNSLFYATSAANGFNPLGPVKIMTDPTGFKVTTLQSGQVTVYIE